MKQIVTGCLFIAAGMMHLAFPAPFLKIMPPWLPWHAALVLISGLAEIAGGIGLMLSRFRYPAALGLVALLLAVFPANIYMATAHVAFAGIAGDSWAQWGRLPLQFLLIWWVWNCRRA